MNIGTGFMNIETCFNRMTNVIKQTIHYDFDKDWSKQIDWNDTKKGIKTLIDLLSAHFDVEPTWRIAIVGFDNNDCNIDFDATLQIQKIVIDNYNGNLNSELTRTMLFDEELLLRAFIVTDYFINKLWIDLVYSNRVLPTTGVTQYYEDYAYNIFYNPSEPTPTHTDFGIDWVYCTRLKRKKWRLNCKGYPRKGWWILVRIQALIRGHNIRWRHPLYLFNQHIGGGN